ncbi:MAG: ATP-binding SpoIIE family protein phosphatase [Betaproteobacteria bacterium]
MNPPAPAPALEFTIKRQSDITLAVMAALRPSFLQTFPSDERGMIGTVVSELATNIVKYAGQGVIRLQALEQEGKFGVRVEAIDQGPGIPDLETALKDGFSTGGTLGLGLPAVRRLTDNLNISCPPGGGTRIEAVRWCRHPVRQPAELVPAARAPLRPAAKPKAAEITPAKPLQLNIQTRNRPYRGFKMSGDRAWSLETLGYALLVQLDGTGHGIRADHAASRIIERIEQQASTWPTRPGNDVVLPLLDACHDAATGTVGAAITLALVDRLTHTLHYVGVGNTCMMVFSPSGWEGVARAGVLGQRYSRPKLTSQVLRPGESVVSFSDGLSSSAVRQLRKRTDRPTEASVIAELLMREAKDSDDASCLVATCLI